MFSLKFPETCVDFKNKSNFLICIFFKTPIYMYSTVVSTITRRK